MATTMEATGTMKEQLLESKNEMLILDSSGDTRITWNRRNNEEVAAARAHFNSLRAKHYLAFRAEGRDGTKGAQIDDFDPSVEQIIMVPRSVGG